MTREQAKENLKKIGIEEPTDEQVTNYLNQFSGETNTLKTQLAEAQKNAQNVEELKKQLKTLEDSKLTDEEKALKDAEAKEQEIASLTAKVKAMELKSQLAEQGIVGEDADKLIESSANGLDVALLGQIIKAKEDAAAKKKEQEIASKSTNPGGGSVGGTDDSGAKPEDVLNAEAMKDAFGTKTADADTQNYYVLN